MSEGCSELFESRCWSSAGGGWFACRLPKLIGRDLLTGLIKGGGDRYYRVLVVQYVFVC
jgi:hypothetical protein